MNNETESEFDNDDSDFQKDFDVVKGSSIFSDSMLSAKKEADNSCHNEVCLSCASLDDTGKNYDRNKERRVDHSCCSVVDVLEKSCEHVINDFFVEQLHDIDKNKQRLLECFEFDYWNHETLIYIVNALKNEILVSSGDEHL